MLQSQKAVSNAVKSILVVENDQTLGELMRLVLAEELLYKTLLITNPYQALEVAKDGHFDLFILDYHLTYFDGFTLYDNLHALAGLEAVPAIMLSSKLKQRERELKKRNLIGLAKPFDLDVLVETVKHYFE